MIEKPKRPKKIPNQDNKQPQTIQELIRRYDLDNTKIYDFLEELVGTLNKKDTYSTEEQVIGTWIDGRNLYRKVITTTIPSGTTSTEVNINVPDYWVLTRLDYRLKANNSTNYAFGNYYASSTDFQRCFFREGAIQVRLGTNNSSVEILFVIEYTKATD